jgi:hypothetical protein
MMNYKLVSALKNQYFIILLSEIPRLIEIVNTKKKAVAKIAAALILNNPVSLYKDNYYSNQCFERYSATPSAEAFMASSPGFQFAGHTSPYSSTCLSASTMRMASSTLRPSGRSFINS